MPEGVGGTQRRQEGSTPPRGFPVAEFEGRLDRARRAMSDAGLDLLLLTTEADVRWFSGFHTQFWQSPTRPWFLLVPRRGRPVAVIPAIGEACMARTWVRDIRTWPSPRPNDEGVTLLGEAIRELAGAHARVGLPTGPGRYLRMSLADFERLGNILPHVTWHDASASLDALRSIKSAAEIDKIRHVCRAASRAFEALPSLLEPGMRDVELFRAFKRRCLDEGVDDVAYLVGAAGPGGYDDIISPPSGRPLASGDVLVLDTGCVFDGHFCDFDRNYALGTADPAAAAAYRVAWRATEAGLAAARPGVRCSELFAAMAGVMAPHAVAGDGAGRAVPAESDGAGHAARAEGGAVGAAAREGGGEVGRLGHGLGTELTEPPSVMPGDDTELRAGMVITLEPGFAFAPGRLMVHEENVLITDDGCELLSLRAPPEMPVIG